jgi:hypothetical protein
MLCHLVLHACLQAAKAFATTPAHDLLMPVMHVLSEILCTADMSLADLAGCLGYTCAGAVD